MGIEIKIIDDAFGNIENINPPKAPSIVLEGEIGDNECLPNFLPIK